MGGNATDAGSDRRHDPILTTLIVDLFAGRAAVSRQDIVDGLGISLDIVKAACRDGRLCEIRCGPRTIRYSRAAVERWLSSEQVDR